jgi:hypothetical protein
MARAGEPPAPRKFARANREAIDPTILKPESPAARKMAQLTAKLDYEPEV